MKNNSKLDVALKNIDSTSEANNFLSDLLTPAEIAEFETRFEIATLLWTTKDSYAKIAKQLKTSTTTVTRVARFLYQEPYQGYKTILHRFYGNSIR